ncbi:MAG TPA: dTDP-glucose 4,6-dehydratase [Firmicutes bacterium]|nr:dTDP-glucose 4,6-dehydratase [Bacillota bacterium]
MNILVTGGCGFIGSNYLNKMVKNYPYDSFVCVDKLTYAGHIENIKNILDLHNFRFIKGDICDKKLIDDLFKEIHFDLIINYAAETHVDTSIKNPDIFLKTNIEGVLNLLEASIKYNVGRFHQVSTDEVYGDKELDSSDSFIETDVLKPSSPYSASKASAELLVMAFHRTFGLDVTISRSVNNYGINQNKEKFIPTIIDCIKNGKEIPVYGKGNNIRSWIDVDKNNYYIDMISRYANNGEIYNISDNLELSNLKLIKMIADHFNIKEYKINFIDDRLGHDKRMSISNYKLKRFILGLEEGRL